MIDFKGTREAFSASFMELAEKDPKVVLVSADSVKAARATAFVEKYPDRYFEAGIAEQNAVAIAAGLASCGLKPYVVTYGGFITMRACEQVRTFVAYNELNVKLVGFNAGLVGGEREGCTHQSLEDMGIMRSIPGITVVAPADAAEVYHAANAISEIEGPVYLRLGSGREQDIFPKDISFELGKIRTLKKYGTDVAIFTNGFITDRAIEAADILNKEGIKATLVEVHTLKPADVEGISAVLSECKGAVTIEDHNINGGLGSLISEISAEHCPTPLVRAGLMDIFPESGPACILADHYNMSVENIIQAVKKVMNRKQ